MIKVIYLKLAPFLLPLFFLTNLVFFAICVWRGEVILGLQAQAIKDQKQVVELVVTQSEVANKVSLEYELLKSDKQQEKVYVDREVEKIVLVPSYSNECFDNAGLQQINSYIASINSASKSESGMSTSAGAN